MPSGYHGAQSGVALGSWGDDQADGKSTGATTRCLAAHWSLKGVCECVCVSLPGLTLQKQHLDPCGSLIHNPNTL